MKKSTIIFFVVTLLATALSCKSKNAQTPQEIQSEEEITSLPPVNPYLAKGNYAVSAFNPSLNNSFHAPVKEGSFQIVTQDLQQIIPALFPQMALNATTEGYYWLKGENTLYYIDASANNWKPVAHINITGQNTDISKLEDFASKNYILGDSLITKLKSVMNNDSEIRIEPFVSLVDKDNVFYSIIGSKLQSFTLADTQNPSKGIRLAQELKLENSLKANDRIVGMQMTYDGHLLLNSQHGMFFVIRRDTLSILNAMQIIPIQHFFSSTAIDEHNGIYALSDSLMIKLVWNGTSLSSREKDGAWTYPIKYESDSLIIAKGGGILSSPVLMGFNNDPDKLVIIFDGARQANIVAFWRDSIPTTHLQEPESRVAGKMEILCGQMKTANRFIQSYHMPAVFGYGVFFANTINNYPYPNTASEIALTGSILPCAAGVERIQWDYRQHHWQRIWAEPNQTTSPMQPVINTNKKMILFSTFNPGGSNVGWNILGLDWNDASRKLDYFFSGNTQYGNGGNGFMQFMNNGDMIFNSIVGTYRIKFGEMENMNTAVRL